jgi:hypothetical protein
MTKQNRYEGRKEHAEIKAVVLSLGFNKNITIVYNNELNYVDKDDYKRSTEYMKVAGNRSRNGY